MIPLEGGRSHLAKQQSNGHRPSLATACVHTRELVETFLAEEVQDPLLRAVQAKARASISVIHEALQRYPQQAVSLSYNGGKDCLVLLILYLCVLAQRHSLRPTSSETYTNGASPSRLADHLPNALPAVYIVSAHPFAAVDSFVETSAQEYALDVVYLSGFARSMREAFAAYLNPRPEVEAIFVGTRRTDPHGAKLSAFNMTDRGWPSFMRIHPVLDWKYREIWAFIRHLKIDYCSLYDEGYTSLGGTLDTHPNPALEIPNHDCTNGTTYEKRFEPAYKLEEDDEERLGREQ